MNGLSLPQWAETGPTALLYAIVCRINYACVRDLRFMRPRGVDVLESLLNDASCNELWADICNVQLFSIGIRLYTVL